MRGRHEGRPRDGLHQAGPGHARHRRARRRGWDPRVPDAGRRPDAGRECRHRRRTGCCRDAARADRAWGTASWVEQPRQASPQRRAARRAWRRAWAAAAEPGPEPGLPPRPPGPAPRARARASARAWEPASVRASRAWGRSALLLPGCSRPEPPGPERTARASARARAGVGPAWGRVAARASRRFRPCRGMHPATCGLPAPPRWRTQTSRTRPDPSTWRVHPYW
ncbi:hypothetical protein SAMN05192558_102515 [Actinokineospora alba]|uniref:Uncharacterized protein n=1 Tax=Actinokineospora alba TaxID=504798 RepID=A0A1H0IDQ8_9PSEU|nr:hypothetical protein C8E96_6618 [Actinokineospora alba]SDI88597.1 hypothetical protein SAMN05421871_108214 [Actinokineospora alba]SDO29554.1 hypothetical protein SAMN05192558_102515 [Actinokineospora alba]